MNTLGRIYSPDSRDELYPVELPQGINENITEQYWWADGWWGNQGNTSECVAYSWSHWLEDGPVIQNEAGADRSIPLFKPHNLYKKCQEFDPWPGEAYSGSTVRAGAKVLQLLGVVTEYRWAMTLDDVVNTILTLGPMVVGTTWYSSMFTPNASNIVSIVGTQHAGGHAYVLNGVDKNKALFRIKNSWGRDWGDNGHGYISFDDFGKLLKEGGEACIAYEKAITSIPDLDGLHAETPTSISLKLS